MSMLAGLYSTDLLGLSREFVGTVGTKIGGLTIPYTFLVGNGELVFGKDNLKCRSIDGEPVAPELIPTVSYLSTKLQDRAKLEGTVLYNGERTKLHDWKLIDLEGTGNVLLELDVGKTDYFAYASTNLNLKERISGEAQTLEEIYVAGKLRTQLVPEFANALDFDLMLLSRERKKTLIVTKGQKAFSYPGARQVAIGGGVDPNDLDSRNEINPFLSAARETYEELGVPVALDQIIFFGLGLDHKTMRPTLFGEATIGLSAEEMMRIADKLSERTFEVGQVIAVDFDLEPLGGIMLMNGWAEPAQACCLISLIHEFSYDCVRDRLSG